MIEARVTALKTRFYVEARQAFKHLRNELVALAEANDSGDFDHAWLATVLEEILKGWILNGGISLTSCPDMRSILARLNRLAGEQLAEAQRGQWRFEILPPCSLFYQEGLKVDMDDQYALMRDIHKLLDSWERAHPERAVALEMFFWGGFNFAEISESLKVSEWTARNWIDQGVAFLRKNLGPGPSTGLP